MKFSAKTGFVTVLILFVYILGKLSINASNTPQQLTRVDRFPSESTLIPVGKNNWRGPQFDREDFVEFVTTHNIETVIRLNGEKRNSMSAKEEEYICNSLGIKFVLVNIEGFSTEEHFNKIFSMLDKGNVYLHCRHGFDRTGATVAAYMNRYGFSKDQIIYHNHWDSYLEEKGDKYKKYYASVNF